MTYEPLWSTILNTVQGRGSREVFRGALKRYELHPGFV